MRSGKHIILIVDDVQSYLNSLERILKSTYCVRTALDLQQAKKEATPDIELALVDISLSQEDASNQDGLTFLRWARERYPTLAIVMMSTSREFEAAVDAPNLDTSEFLKKPVNTARLKDLLKRLFEERR